MTRREVPEPWATAMIHAGITHPRNPDQPSMGQLAQRVGVHTSTISSMVFGERATDQATIDATADILRLDPTTVAEWAGRARSVRDPYQPPTISSLMDQDQRNIVDAIIRQFTAHARAAGTPDDDVRAEVEDTEGATRLRPKSQARLKRDLEKARTARQELAAENDPVFADAIERLDATIAALERDLRPDAGSRRNTGT